MKNLKLLLMGLIALVPLAASAQINHRQSNHRDRIVQGYHRGSLTRSEVARLRARQAAIRAQERRDRRDGRGLSYRERARLLRQQSELNRRIYRQKRDRQYRGRY